MQRWFHRLGWSTLAIQLCFLSIFSALNASADTISLVVTEGRVVYHASSPLVSWKGTNESLWGTIRFEQDGTRLFGQLCVDQARWDSGRSRRDLHTRRMFETRTYPHACFELHEKQDKPDKPDAGNKVDLHGTMRIHGVERDMTISGVINKAGSGWTFRGSFRTRITTWEMTPPQIVFMQVRDRVKVDVIVSLAPYQKVGDTRSHAARSLNRSGPDTSPALYQAYCGSCHLASGRGIPGMGPPLRNRLGPFLRHPKGRGYLARVVLFGLVGPVAIRDTTYDGHMPAFSNMGTFDNETAADLMNELVFQLNHRDIPPGFKPYTEQEIARYRSSPSTPNRLYKLRRKILREKGDFSPSNK